MTKVVYDLKLGPAGIKRWIVKYSFNRYICWECRASFYLEERSWTRSKYGPGLRAYIIYQIIEVRLPQRVVAQSLNQLFGFNLHVSVIARLKEDSADLYRETYEAILTRLITGRLLHADETKINLVGKEGFVWVLQTWKRWCISIPTPERVIPLNPYCRTFKGFWYLTFMRCMTHLIVPSKNAY
jgi:hypothetical protein